MGYGLNSTGSGQDTMAGFCDTIKNLFLVPKKQGCWVPLNDGPFLSAWYQLSEKVNFFNTNLDYLAALHKVGYTVFDVPIIKLT